jgi:muconolactone delta-isomerase
MKILAIEHELAGATADQFQKYAVAEARKAWDLTQAGILRESYFRADRNEAVLILECASVIETEKILSELPFVRNKLITFDLIPLKPYPGFERLFVRE